MPKYFRNTRLKCEELEKPQANATSVIRFPACVSSSWRQCCSLAPPDEIAHRHAAFAEQHVQIALGAAERGGNLVDAQIRIAQVLADEDLGADVHRLGSDAIEHRVRLAKRQQQEIDQRIGDADGAVRRQFCRFVERRMCEVMGDPPRSRARRQLAGRHLVQPEAPLLQQFLGHDDDLVPRQPRADDGMWTADVVGEAIAGHQLDVAALLLEIGDAMSLEQDLDIRMFARPRARHGKGDPVLARLDLAELEPGNGRIIDAPLERGALQRIDVELAAEIGQCV